MSDIDLDQLMREIGSPLWASRMKATVRLSTLARELESKYHAEDLRVLAATDGRTLEKRKDAVGYVLDVGDEPQLWLVDEADHVSRDWNRSPLGKKDPVTPIRWQEHFKSQIARIEARLEAMGQG